MRAVHLLSMLAVADVVIVAATAGDPTSRAAVAPLRVELLGIFVVAGAGAVALAGLSLLTRWCRRRLRGAALAAGLLAIGLAYGLAPPAFAAWMCLWLTPRHFPVALVCGASAVLLLWQGFMAEQTPGEPAAGGRRGT
jgi:hypothetical protein